MTKSLFCCFFFLESAIKSLLVAWAAAKSPTRLVSTDFMAQDTRYCQKTFTRQLTNVLTPTPSMFSVQDFFKYTSKYRTMNTPLMKAQGKEFQSVEANSQHVFILE